MLLAACLFSSAAYKRLRVPLDAQDLPRDSRRREKSGEGAGGGEVTIGTRTIARTLHSAERARARGGCTVVFDGRPGPQEFDGWVEDAFYAKLFQRGRRGGPAGRCSHHVSNVDAEPRHATKLGNQLTLIEALAEGFPPSTPEHAYLDRPGTATKDAERGCHLAARRLRLWIRGEKR